ncbi:hypothetical protein MuYL_1746 [Mucilaginibacter xinganensis]|uniref:Uncharacterized protein n=1 Tax=Mucilaginibacter xinganensis TaxID=1234841 RepID=A0A223NUT4_9SPHI|nr:hypothetical protein MuYL_1746 [Mucilaginibacter xinganensis]
MKGVIFHFWKQIIIFLLRLKDLIGFTTFQAGSKEGLTVIKLIRSL